MSTAYRIKDWGKHFENNRTRELKSMTWVPVPNKQDGDGYTALMDHKHGTAHYGAWHVILGIASKCDPRGTLMRDSGQPHTITSISRITRVPEPLLKQAMDRLVSSEIGWVEVVDSQTLEPSPQEYATSSQDAASASDITEGNGREGKGREQTPEALRLAGALADSILTWKPDYAELSNGSREKTIERWASDVDRALRLDSRNPEKVDQVIRWLPSHDSGSGFKWRENILSGVKLRKQFDKLEMAMAAGSGNGTRAKKPLRHPLTARDRGQQ